MITVDKLTMDFKMNNLPFARELYASWEPFFQRSVERVIDEQLSPLDKEDSLISVDLLEINIGTLLEEEFYQSFPKRFANALYEHFHNLLLQYGQSPSSSGIEIKSLASSLSDRLIFFLHYGYIPSPMQHDNCQPSDLLRKIIQSEENTFIKLLQDGWKYTNFRYRLTSQFNDEELQNIVSLIYQEEANYIGTCVQKNTPLYSYADRNHISQNIFHHVLWIISFTFLFENVNTPFSRKTYLSYLIRNLAAHYNLSYQELLIALCGEALENHQEILFLPELLQLQEELKNSTEEKSKKHIVIESETIIKQSQDKTKPTTNNANVRNSTSSLTTESDFFSADDENQHLRAPISNLKKEKETISRSKEPQTQSNTGINTANNRNQNQNQNNNNNNEINLPQKANAPKQYNESTKQSFSADQILLPQSKKKQKENAQNALDINRVFISNAGLVMLSPFLPRLFSLLKLTEDGIFVNSESKIRAIFILQQLLFDEWDRFPESDLTLNKILVGMALDEHPLPLRVELTEEEKKTCMSLLEGVKQHWQKLKNTSRKSFQETFLRREGVLEQTDKGWQVCVKEEAYDVLLDTIPWSYKTIKYVWMADAIHVKWR
ncbi:hypothetical protein LJC52_02830 [Bacteroidales bacterium OttesenSCG-928-A17]|nr:hypothetical protein [Bacteroidales bacterium OttesenSCG-928-A17]